MRASVIFRAIVLQLLTVNALSQYRIREGCSGRQQLLDLRRGHYPRFLPTLDCGPGICLPQYCQPKTYSVKVLKSRSEDDPEDVSLPESLRDSWIFVFKTVTVACMCNLF